MGNRDAHLIPTLVSVDATWTQYGACHSSRIDPDIWFPIDPAGMDAVTARSICSRCPVRDLCAAEADNRPDTIGIWGGQDENERRNNRRRQKEKSRRS